MKACLLVFILLFSLSAFAQKKAVIASVEGDSGIYLQSATVSILRGKDSTLVKYGRTDKSGKVILSNLLEGKYLLLLSFTGYQDKKIDVDIHSTDPDTIFLQKIILKTTQNALKEVIVSRKLTGIRIVGDTTEFIASFFKTKPQASVEELIKLLPGMQVDKNGTITAQGETVKQVLVDGNEFFSDDPTLVTRNLYADMVDKVELFDKKSNRATFTGIDDGVSNKTINITLNKDQKRATFGKIESSKGQSDYYQGQAVYNNFNNNRKFSVFALRANTSQTGLLSQDNFLADDDNSESELDASDWNGKYSGKGIPRSTNGGIHYEDKWNAQKHSFNLNYKISQLNVDGFEKSLYQNSILGNVLQNEAKHEYTNQSFTQQLNAKYQIKASETSQLIFSLNGFYAKKSDQNNYNSSNIFLPGDTLNTSARQISYDGFSRRLKLNATWEKRFVNSRSTLTTDFWVISDAARNSGYLIANTVFKNNSVTDSSQNINQQRGIKNSFSDIGIHSSYTKSLGSGAGIVTDYQYAYLSRHTERLVYNRDQSDHYSQFDTLLSNVLSYNRHANQFSSFFNFHRGKILLDAGADLLGLQMDRRWSTGVENTFYLKLLPAGRFKYSFSTQRIISLQVKNDFEAPTVLQLNPVLINDDPVNTVRGAASLMPSLNSRYTLVFRDYSMMSNRTFLVNTTLTHTENPIVLDLFVDSSGKTASSYYSERNHPNNFLKSYFLYSKRISSLNLNLSIDGSFSSTSYNNRINSVTNSTKAKIYNLGLGFSRLKENLYDVALNLKAFYNNNRAGQQSLFSNNYWSFLGTFSLDLPSILGVEWHQELTYTLLKKSASFSQDFHQLIWDMFLAKKVLKSKSLEIRLSVNDLLNQNSGYVRTVTGNAYAQNEYATIKRYWLFSLIWSFHNKQKK